MDAVEVVAAVCEAPRLANWDWRCRDGVHHATHNWARACGVTS
jgi:hypothetical protein